MTVGLRPYPEYKDFGLPWLGQVPGDWKIERGKWLFRRLQRPVQQGDDVVTCFRDGMVTLRKNRRTAGFTNSLQEIGYQGVRRGDLVIHAMDAFAGAVGVADSDGKCTPVYAVCIPRHDLNSNYYAYVVREMARTLWILALAKGIRERSTDFRFDTFGSQYLPVPPRNEQDAISAFLHDRDRRIRLFIRNRRRLIGVLNEQKQAIIKQAVTRGLDPNVPLKPSGIDWLGNIPEHWEVWQIGHFAAIGNGSTPSRGNMAYWSGGTYPWLNSGSVNAGTITEADQFVTDQALKDCHLPRVKPGSVLIGITGQGKTRGTAAVLAIEATINQHVAFIHPRSYGKTATPEYLQAFLIAAYPELRRMSDDSGSTKGALTCHALLHFNVILPPKEEQNRIVSQFKAETHEVEAAIRTAQREIDLIREYRTRLIADVVTGKVDVRHLASPPEAVEVEVEPDDLDEGLDDEMPGEDEAELSEEVTDADD